MNYYKAYGLKIQSEIELPELTPLESEIEEKEVHIKIKKGEICENLQNPIHKGLRFETNESEFLLKLNAIGKYYVKDGNQIIVQENEKSSQEDIRLFLLGSAFGALLHQRKKFILHASTIEVKEGAIAFAGNSGVGKSTIVGAFHKNGYGMISDDVTAVDFDEEDIPNVIPGFNRLKLWEDAAQILEHNIEEAIKIRQNIQKYNINLEKDFINKELPLKKIYILNTHNKKEIQIEEIKSFDKIFELVKNTYRIKFSQSQENKKNHLIQCNKIAQKVQMYKVIRPEDIDLKDFYSFMKSEVEK